MPDSIATLVAFAQSIILITVGIVWVSSAIKFWKHNTKVSMSELHWGGALLILSFWRTAAWLDSQVMASITTEGTWALTLVVWTAVALICAVNFVIWLRGRDELPS